MELEIKGVHLDVRDETKEFIKEKLSKVEFANDYVMSLDFTLTRENTEFLAEAKLHFTWGPAPVIKTRSFDLHESINTLIDKVEHKIKKERDKVTDHKTQ